MLQHLRRQLEYAALYHPDQRVIVAVSGGPDSLCLLHLLVALRPLGGPQVHVVHLDHGFRGAESAAEAAFVAATAATWGVPATIEYAADLPAHAHEQRLNRQAAAREARYALLARVATTLEAAAILTAHQADDQAETLLMHLVRGTGIAGLRGMRPSAPWREWAPAALVATHPNGPPLIRPLLAIRRSAIETYCREQNLQPRTDPSNQSRTALRSRIRAELLPLLTTYNPQVVEALGRTAQLAADDYAFLQLQVDNVWIDLVMVGTRGLDFAPGIWHTLAPTIQRYALRRAAQQLIGSDELAYERIETARIAIAAGQPAVLTLGHGLVLRIGPLRIELGVGAPAPAEPMYPQLVYEPMVLANPGITLIGIGWQVQVAPTTDAIPPTTPWQIVLDADSLDGPLLLRGRRSGDRFRPVGGRGSRLVQDFFVDQKIPRELRAAWPILATPERILWIAGLRADNHCIATPQSRNLIRISVRTGSAALGGNR